MNIDKIDFDKMVSDLGLNGAYVNRRFSGCYVWGNVCVKNRERGTD